MCSTVVLHCTNPKCDKRIPAAGGIWNNGYVLCGFARDRLRLQEVTGSPVCRWPWVFEDVVGRVSECGSCGGAKGMREVERKMGELVHALGMRA